MGFFKTLHDDVEKLWDKIKGSSALSEAEKAIKGEIVSVVDRLIGYVESRLPELEAAAAAAVVAEIPGAAPIVVAAGVVAEAATKKALDEVQQKVDSEEPK